MDDLKKVLKEGKVIIGKDRIIKLLKKGKLKRVYLAKNCQEDAKEDIKHYGNLYKIEIKETDESNVELGVVCKKPFSIMVCGY